MIGKFSNNIEDCTCQVATVPVGNFLDNWDMSKRAWLYDTHGPKAVGMGLDHEWGSGMSSPVATSQLKEPRGKKRKSSQTAIFTTLSGYGNILQKALLL